MDVIGEIPVVLTTLNTAMTAMNKNYGITQLVNPETKMLDVQGYKTTSILLNSLNRTPQIRFYSIFRDRKSVV